MKHISYFCVSLLIACLFAVVHSESVAAIEVKTIARSLNSMTAPVPGAPVPPWDISNGLRAVGIQSRVYFSVDTAGSGATGSPVWTVLAKPAGSTATLDSTGGQLINSIKVDMVGTYVIGATVGGQSSSDTVFASTYSGVGTDAQAGCFCHSNASSIKTKWQASKHSQIFKKGVTGQLNAEIGKGRYSPACIQCHTTGWNADANNNNFGYQAKQTGWDTSWTIGLERFGFYYLINTGDTSRWMMLNQDQMKQANIGCESCHGPLADHRTTADKKKAGLSISAGVCNQCHDGSRRHSLGTFYEKSMHNTLEVAGFASTRSNCQPCHSGAGFLYYTRNAPASFDTVGLAAAWNADRDGYTSISCQVCHDPHGGTNPYQLRTVRLDSLRNGYRIPEAYNNNPGMLCGHCHASRYSVKDRVTNVPPYYGFADRHYPHYNMQLDMLVGSNGFQYGDETYTGLNTHASLDGGCATCHMQHRINRLDGGRNALANHSFSMTDTLFGTGVYKPVDACRDCHGEIEDFDDIRAFYDFDRDGQIEGVQTEVHGLLDALKARLPIDSATGEPVNRLKDTLLVKNRPDYVQGIWNYYFVKYDRSYGVHNTKYTVRLLYKSLGWTPLAVKELPGMPAGYDLAQNYPNPFNPTTNIRFSLPQEEHVRLHIFDITGRLVKTLINEAITAGNREVAWDGTNEDGQRVASGMYLYRIQTENFASIKKMVLMK